MNSKKLISFIILLIAIGVLLFLNKSESENKRENSMNQTTDTQTSSSFTSRLKTMDTTSLETLTEKLTELKTEVVLPSESTDERYVQAGDSITVNYRGWFASTGEIFDESFSRGDDGFTFTNGTGVIEGWSEGTLGMKVGEVRKIYVPAALGYGDADYGGIPANSDLIFDVELIKFN